MIDWDRVRGLRLEIGPNTFEEVLDLFLEEVETGLAGLHDTMPESERTERLHFLAGSALNLGFATFAGLCQAVERGQHTATAAEILGCYDRSRAEFLANIGKALAA
ncbi:Hpt domain-containing protein [Roseovarius autotrophicus]|uniref:Hpt domain-containing protein n=1 Tax=Roseovarius autotrophicus TaxID=2824121 RepID=UPI0019F444D1|nr:Hpt domain-containing protein [Roseovarius autotrophicus]MBE0453450.1 Hpt domain-containing protein [Roseovarius sp.]